jgi:hypothetical protein
LAVVAQATVLGFVARAVRAGAVVDDAEVA